MGYADRVAKAREERMFRLPEGDYPKVKYLGYKFEKTKTKKEPIFKMEFKVLEAPTEEVLEKVKAKNRNVEVKFMPSVDFQMNALLEFMNDVGLDLEACDEKDVTEFTDLRKQLDRLDDVVLVCAGKLKPQENPQYYNFYLKKVPNLFEVTASAPAVAVPVITREQMLAAGWTDELMRANPAYAHLALPVAVVVPVVPVVPVVEAPVVVEPVVVAPVVTEAPVVQPAPVAVAPVVVAPASPAPAPVAPVAPVAPAPIAPAVPA